MNAEHEFEKHALAEVIFYAAPPSNPHGLTSFTGSSDSTHRPASDFVFDEPYTKEATERALGFAAALLDSDWLADHDRRLEDRVRRKAGAVEVEYAWHTADGEHIWPWDDVTETGATLEACEQALNEDWWEGEAGGDDLFLVERVKATKPGPLRGRLAARKAPGSPGPFVRSTATKVRE